MLQYKPREWRAADSLVVGYIFAEALSTTWQLDLMRAALRDVPPEKRAKLLPEISPLDVVVVGSDTTSKAMRAAIDTTQRTLFSSSQIEITNDMLVELDTINATMQRSLERVGFFAEERAASNNWVVSGKHTTTGKPLLANDPHLQASAPNIWHMVNLSAKDFHVAGVTAPGIPGVILGHNEFIAWGATNLGPDVQDLYLEHFDKMNPRMYQTPNGMREAEIRREEIKVRKNLTSPETEIVPFDVTITRHGPIIFEKDTARYALQWTALNTQSTDLFAAFYNLDHARNWDEFRKSLATYQGATQNFIYADTKGHIGYYGAGAIPIRKSGDGSTPYDGATDNGEWTSFIPFNELPHEFDPPSGVIVTANSRVVGIDYKHFLTHDWAQPYRARRIYDLLNAKPKLSPADFQNVQGDTYSIGGTIFAREVAKLLSPMASDDEKLRSDVLLFQNWDGHVNADSRAALFANEVRLLFRQRILNAAIGDERAKTFRWAMFDTTLDDIITSQPREWLPKEFQTNDKGYVAFLLTCVRGARENLTKRYGADESKWTWGNYRKVSFPHPLATVPLFGQQFVVPPFGQNGNGGGGIGPTVNVGNSVSMRFIADPSNWDNTRHGIPIGESGNPSNPHWKDQLDNWRNVTPQIFPFTPKAIERETKETLTLEPK
ncbi:MAG: penicillin acylase family protein [Pyrinomonadaceae bacterium]